MFKEAAKKRILVIDDDEHVLISLEGLLETEGYETRTAWSGKEGLELLRSQKFDLVLLDDYLWDIEHEEILKEIQRMEIQPLVILTESAPLPEARRRYTDLGACATIGKWAPSDEIVAEIRKCFTKAAIETVAA